VGPESGGRSGLDVGNVVKDLGKSAGGLACDPKGVHAYLLATHSLTFILNKKK
jgi:hypothetical protein